MKVKILNKSPFEIPKYKTEGSAGVDLQAFINKPIILAPMERCLIPTGIFISLPEGYEAQVRARSGLAIKHGISLVNGIGTIDSDYRGEIKVILINLGQEDYCINNGDRIGQLIFARYEKANFIEVEVLDDTKRGQGGFGHSGY